MNSGAQAQAELPLTGPELRVSAAWLQRAHDCTLNGITTRCGAACCTAGPGGTYWPARAFGRADGRCGNLGPLGCTLSAADKPVTCHLYPLMINGSGTLVLHHRATTGRGVCKGCHGHGPPLVDALRDNLVELLGGAAYAHLRAEVMANRDVRVAVPPAVWAAWLAERQEEAANETPPPRSQRAWPRNE